MGRVEKGVNCSVQGCTSTAVRSLSKERLTGSDLRVSSQGRRAYLCESHYKEWKKKTKQVRDLERVRYL